MNYYHLLKKYAEGKGEKSMWAATKRVSDFLEKMQAEHPEEVWGLIKGTYAEMCGPHFNEEFGEWQIAQMFYKDRQGVVHRAPNKTKEQYKALYDMYKGRIKDGNYTCWDFAVATEMHYNDYHCKLHEWFPNATEEDIMNKAVELAVAYLNDDDDAEEGKIWRRFN